MLRWFDITMKEIASKFCPKGEEEDFAEWAFGEKYRSMDCQEMLDSWNALHGNLVKFNGDGRIVNDVETMVEVWMKHGREEEDGDQIHAMMHALLPILNLCSKEVGLTAMIHLCLYEGIKSFEKKDFLKIIDRGWDHLKEEVDAKGRSCCGKH